MAESPPVRVGGGVGGVCLLPVRTGPTIALEHQPEIRWTSAGAFPSRAAPHDRILSVPQSPRTVARAAVPGGCSPWDKGPALRGHPGKRALDPLIGRGPARQRISRATASAVAANLFTEIV